MKIIFRNYKKKIFFAGSGKFAMVHLKSLIKLKYNIVAILTQPNKPSGRGQKIQLSEIQQIAKENNIIIFTAQNIYDIEQEKKIFQIYADILVVVSYGVILPNFFLKKFSLGAINVHASLLPKWRGPAPIQWSILSGDKITGVTTIYMEKTVDTGPIIHSISCPIFKKDNYIDIFNKLSLIGIECLNITLQKIINNTVTLIPQNEKKATYSKKIFKKNSLINWNNTANYIEKMTRAFNPWPIPYFLYKKKNIKVWKVNIIKKKLKNTNNGIIYKINQNGLQITTLENILQIKKLQIPGKKIVTFLDFLNANKNFFVEGDHTN
ncbi:methionyl-tRNA formyltransferase [Buchnera aphidicola (Thelaxes californica)]|uniref:Methionyl-tRNA formyltransferase n=1 Tax=Buchnera aphidicola (Thelaxes californica) TaxID=1315998 RepID=A0A4D6YJW6_9GAMM|nr:methionyl-tRNA formyltransferase [Buchnera aphidicola]QCI26901.1 methionyl-tRNA formyltransferase [Buchnera aphidicola (Thelaxes californica)]